MQKHYITDLKDCRKLWNRLFRPLNISDTWEFRACFQNHYHNPPCFVLLEDRQGIAGMLPLSYLEKEDRYVFFPGETWKGKTWLERTPVYFRNRNILENLFFECPENTYLRYMEPAEWSPHQRIEIDEIAYTLQPASMDFDIACYLKRFSTKRLKSITKEITSLTACGSKLHINRLADFNRMIEWNLERYNADSYFSDERFADSFKDVMHFLHRSGLLRLVSLEIGGEIAAVDLGALFNGTYTIFAGGTNSLFPGVAKAINMYHIETAFAQKFSRIDFLCGDFVWKKLWHFDPEPLFKFDTQPLENEIEVFGNDSPNIPNRLIKRNQKQINPMEERCYVA